MNIEWTRSNELDRMKEKTEKEWTMKWITGKYRSVQIAHSACWIMKRSR